MSWIKKVNDSKFKVEPKDADYEKNSGKTVQVTVRADDTLTKPNSDVKLLISFPDYKALSCLTTKLSLQTAL